MVVGAITMTNSDFLAEIYGELAPGHHGWVCSFAADPSNASPGVWGGRAYKGMPNQAALIDRSVQDNTYFCTSVLTATDDGEIVRRKDAFVRLAVLVLDDVQLSDVQGFSYAIQTSPGKFQVGIFLDGEDTDAQNRPLVDRVMSALAARGRSNDASGNACVRYVRLPGGTNTKPRASGTWQVRLESWHPNVRWTLDDACAAVGIDLDSLRISVGLSNTASTSTGTGSGTHAGEMIASLTAPLGERAYHDSITRLAASLVSGGMYPGAACEFLYSLMDQVKPGTRDGEELKRWESRRQEIPRAVKSAEKFAPENRKPPSITVNLRLGGGSPDEPGELLLDLAALQQRSGLVRWQVKGMIPDDSMGMIFGASGTFKSFIALDHGLHVAHGMQWMGRKTKQGAVVYVAAEGGAGIARRVQAWHRKHNLELAQNFHVCITPMVLSMAEHVEILATEIAKLPQPPSLIYIDTLSQTFEGDENSATDIASYLRTINASIRARFNASVVVIHHSGHAATERPRGSSAITANVDFMLGVYRPAADKLQARVDVIKQKDGDRYSGQGFELERAILGHDEDGDEISSLVATWSDITGRLLAAQAVRLSGHEQLLAQMLQKTGWMYDRDMRHEFYNHLGQEAVRNGKTYVQDSAKKAYARAYQSLHSKNLVVMDAAGVVKLLEVQPGHDRDITGQNGT
jgi:AAA domain/RepB DNA-primase from phage plasmid